MSGLKRIIQDWLLPGSIVCGVSIYFAYRAIPALHPAGAFLGSFASEVQRCVIAVLLFLQFVKVSPHDLKPTRWHAIALAFQVIAFGLCAAILLLIPAGELRIMIECAMICLICPTAAAAGVITDKLGGSLPGTISYNVITNLAATFLIPLVIPIVHPSESLGFWAYVGHLALKVFPLLVLPAILAWIIRYTTHKLQRKLMRLTRYAFYIWGIGLTTAMLLATRALVHSGMGVAAVACIVLVSAGVCAVQFAFGRAIGHGWQEKITAGQSLGQKNTGFIIWLGYNYMTPVTSLAGGLYAIWQNLFNSWELYQSSHSPKAKN